jgi:hypothetical protein
MNKVTNIAARADSLVGASVRNNVIATAQLKLLMFTAFPPIDRTPPALNVRPLNIFSRSSTAVSCLGVRFRTHRLQHYEQWESIYKYFRRKVC